MTRCRGNNLDRIYKASNNSIINNSKNISKKRLKACLIMNTLAHMMSVAVAYMASSRTRNKKTTM